MFRAKKERKIFRYRSSAPRWPTTLEDGNSGSRRLKILFLISLFGIWIYWILYSDWFKIQNFEILGPKPTLNTNLAEYLAMDSRRQFWLIPKDDIFSFYLSDENTLKQKFNLESFSLQKNYLDKTIYFAYKIRMPVLMVIDKDLTTFLDKNGQPVLGLEADTLTSRLPILFIKKDLSGEVINRQLIQAIQRIDKLANELSFKIIAYNLEDSPELPVKPETTISLQKSWELTAVTNWGWSIRFGDGVFKDSNDLAQQLYNLNTFVREKVKKLKNPKQLKYLDLRFGEKVYYK